MPPHPSAFSRRTCQDLPPYSVQSVRFIASENKPAQHIHTLEMFYYDTSFCGARSSPYASNNVVHHVGSGMCTMDGFSGGFNGTLQFSFYFLTSVSVLSYFHLILSLSYTHANPSWE